MRSHSQGLKALLLGLLVISAAAISVTTALASNPSYYQDPANPCPAYGESYAGPSAGTVSYSRTYTGCQGGSPYDARLEAYFWDGGWWGIVVYDSTYAYYSRTLYSAAVEGWHHTQFIVSPYQRNGHTYAP